MVKGYIIILFCFPVLLQTRHRNVMSLETSRPFMSLVRKVLLCFHDSHKCLQWVTSFCLLFRFLFADSTQRAEAAYQQCKKNVVFMTHTIKMSMCFFFSPASVHLCVTLSIRATSPSPTSPHSPSWPLFSAPSSPQPASSASSDSSPVRWVHCVRAFVTVNAPLSTVKLEKAAWLFLQEITRTLVEIC